MDNTLDNKSKFIAQYWGQQILKVKGAESTTQFVNGGWIFASPGVYLELKPLSAISDEELTQVASLMDKTYDAPYPQDSKNAHSVEDARTWLTINTQYCANLPIMFSDYLRSKAYLLPFHDLTTEQLIEYGWAKLKTV